MSFTSETRRVVQRHIALHLMAYCSQDPKDYTKTRITECWNAIVAMTQHIVNERYSVNIELHEDHEALTISKGENQVFHIDNKNKAVGKEYYAIKCYFIRIRREGKQAACYDRHIKKHIFSEYRPRK